MAKVPFGQALAGYLITAHHLYVSLLYGVATCVAA